MNRLFLTLPLLLLAVATGVGAMEITTTIGCISGSDCDRAERRAEIKEVVKEVLGIDEAGCAAKMEQAMRDMEPFIPHDHGTFMEQLTLKNLGPFKAASKQWEAVKRECWREP